MSSIGQQNLSNRCMLVVCFMPSKRGTKVGFVFLGKEENEVGHAKSHRTKGQFLCFLLKFTKLNWLTNDVVGGYINGVETNSLWLQPLTSLVLVFACFRGIGRFVSWVLAILIGACTFFMSLFFS